MNRKLILFAVIVLVLSISIANAQTVWDKQTYNQPDSADLLPNSGRIILNGRLLEPPYDIIVQNDTIKINGISLISQGTPIAMDRDTNSIKNAEIKYNLLSASIDSFDNACKNVGYDSALIVMLDYFNGKDIVDSAYIDEHFGFSVKFKDAIGPEWIWYEPTIPDSLKKWGEMQSYNAMVQHATLIRKAVGNGNLVILGYRGGEAHLSYAQKWIKEINRIVTSSQLSREEKFNALRRIAKDDHNAEDILENWGKR
jgi:hypothetical protein